jgi:DNA-binding NarL/FixJ family response regulator
MTLTEAPDSNSGSTELSRGRRVLLLDRQRIFREAVVLLFANQTEFTVVGDAGQESDALALIAALHPDVVVTELHLGDGSSVKDIEEIHARFPDVGILVLTTLRASDVAARVKKAGALGLLLKDQDHVELCVALREVAAGRRYLGGSRAVARTQQRKRAGVSQKSTGVALLTERQRQVLRSVALGYRTREIAQMLGVSVKAVYRQRERLRHALQLPNTATLTRFAAREGLIES